MDLAIKMSVIFRFHKHQKCSPSVIDTPPSPSDKLPKHEIMLALAGLTLKYYVSLGAIKKHGFHISQVPCKPWWPLEEKCSTRVKLAPLGPKHPWSSIFRSCLFMVCRLRYPAQAGNHPRGLLGPSASASFWHAQSDLTLTQFKYGDIYLLIKSGLLHNLVQQQMQGKIVEGGSRNANTMTCLQQTAWQWQW